MTVMLKTETLIEKMQIHRVANPHEIVDYNFDLAASSLGLEGALPRGKRQYPGSDGRCQQPDPYHFRYRPW